MNDFEAFVYIEYLAAQVESGEQLKLTVNDAPKRRKSTSIDPQYTIKTRSSNKKPLTVNKNKFNIEQNQVKSVSKPRVSEGHSDKENTTITLDSSIESEPSIIIIDEVKPSDDEIIEKSFVRSVKCNRGPRHFSSPKEFTMEVMKVLFSKDELKMYAFHDLTRRFQSMKRSNFDDEKTELLKGVLKVHYNLDDVKFEKFWKTLRIEINKELSLGKF